MNNISESNKPDFDTLLNSLYLKAQKQINIKKENDRIYNENLNLLKDMLSKLNNLLKELDIDGEMEFVISEKKEDFKTNMEKIIGDKLDAEIKNIFEEIINEIETKFQSLNKYILLHKKPKIIDYQKILTKPIDETKTQEPKPNEKSDTSKKTNLDKNKEIYYVEFAITTSQIDRLEKNIDDVIDLEIDAMKKRNGKFLPNGKKKLKKPDMIIIDNETDMKNYVEEHQTSGRLCFYNEDDAKVWRCLTFDINYHKRPYSIYVLKNQLIF